MVTPACQNSAPDTAIRPENLLDNISVSFKDETEVQPLSPILKPKRQMTQPLVLTIDELEDNGFQDMA